MSNRLINKKDSNGGFYAAILFLIWPVLSVVAAFKNYRQSWAKNIFWAFCVFYGLSFAFGSENKGSDINRYVAELERLYDVEMSLNEAQLYFEESEEVDVLRTVIAVSLSRVTDSQTILIMIYGAIFGFFFSRNLWYILDRLQGKILPVTLILLACFFMVNPIWNINGFRMWTATHIFIYGLLPYLCEGKKHMLIFCFGSIFVHFSFILPVAVLVGYMIFGNRLVLYFCFFISSIFIAEIDISAFNDIINSYLPESFQERSAGYRGEETVEEFRTSVSDNNWYAIWYTSALKWSMIGFLCVLFFKGRTFFEENRMWLNLFSFVLLFYGVANLLSSIPSGGRYLVIANLAALSLIIYYVQNQPQEKVMKRFILLSVPALLLYVIVAFRIGLYSMSATAVFGNPIVAFFTAGENISLNDVMRMIL